MRAITFTDTDGRKWKVWLRGAYQKSITGARTLKAMKKRCADDREGVTFSTIHKAKGSESERVFILNPDELGSHPKAVQEWERDQEIHIAYVGFSRSKDAMYFVSGA